MFKRFFKARAERRQAAEESRRQESARFQAELLDPQFDVIEEIYGKPISKSLRALYEDVNELSKSYIDKIVDGKAEDKWIFITCYYPLNHAQVEGQWLQDGKHYAFAGDGSGSEWVVDPTSDQSEILFFEHETGELKPTGVRMAQFLLLSENTGDV